MDNVDYSIEGPLPLGGRAYPSERTYHQDSARVKTQTPRKEVFLLITSSSVIVFVFGSLMFRAVFQFCSIRGKHRREEPVDQQIWQPRKNY